MFLHDPANGDYEADYIDCSGMKPLKGKDAELCPLTIGFRKLKKAEYYKPLHLNFEKKKGTHSNTMENIDARLSQLRGLKKDADILAEVQKTIPDVKLWKEKAVDGSTKELDAFIASVVAKEAQKAKAVIKQVEDLLSQKTHAKEISTTMVQAEEALAFMNVVKANGFLTGDVNDVVHQLDDLNPKLAAKVALNGAAPLLEKMKGIDIMNEEKAKTFSAECKSIIKISTPEQLQEHKDAAMRIIKEAYTAAAEAMKKSNACADVATQVQTQFTTLSKFLPKEGGCTPSDVATMSSLLDTAAKLKKSCDDYDKLGATPADRAKHADGKDSLTIIQSHKKSLAALHTKTQVVQMKMLEPLTKKEVAFLEKDAPKYAATLQQATQMVLEINGGLVVWVGRGMWEGGGKSELG
jgi:hypothetical protein